VTDASDADAAAAPLPAHYFDGLSARPREVLLRLHGPTLHIDGADGLALRVRADRVRWPERTRHGARIAPLRDGGSLQALDAQAWDDWARRSGVGESAVVRAQQTWRSTLIALALLVLLAGAGYRWGVPALARVLLVALPESADRAVGTAALRSFDGVLLWPSKVPAARQEALRADFAKAVASAGPALADTRWELHFSDSPTHAAGQRRGLGPNAFALPGGSIVVTDELLTLLQGRDDVLLGVLGHELGHVRRRHGMRLLVQAGLVATASSVVWGDFSSVLATAPALLGQLAYSRDFEREADADAIALLRGAGVSPAVMTELFERVAAQRGKRAEDDDGGALGLGLASHPATAERIARFRDAAAR